MFPQKIKQKGCGECAAAHNEQGTEKRPSFGLYRPVLSLSKGALQEGILPTAFRVWKINVNIKSALFSLDFSYYVRSVHPASGMCQG